MDSIEKNFIKSITETLSKKLERKLTRKEMNFIRQPRAYIGYEMILDFVSDENIKKQDAENYIEQALKENK